MRLLELLDAILQEERKQGKTNKEFSIIELSRAADCGDISLIFKLSENMSANGRINKKNILLKLYPIHPIN